MSVVIVDINSTTLQKTGNMTTSPEKEARMLPLEEYYKIAKRTILHFAGHSLAKSMVKDEDALAFIAESLMRATLRWQPGGRTLRSYLNQCSIWAIRRWVLNKKQANKYDSVSLDFEVDDEGNSMHNFIADPHVGGNIEEIIDRAYLNETQKECLRLRYVNGMTFRDIGTALNKTGQRIEQIVDAALNKLRNEYHSTNEI
jgi:RNA polymerase sigma factor (sigma-70 family)